MNTLWYKGRKISQMLIHVIEEDNVFKNNFNGFNNAA